MLTMLCIFFVSRQTGTNWLWRKWSNPHMFVGQSGEKQGKTSFCLLC